jgi:capsular exopolysaccharide synthesis family protein
LKNGGGNKVFTFIKRYFAKLTNYREHIYVGKIFNRMVKQIELLDDKGFKSILITSSLKGEGKSLIASNLAIAFAKSGKQTVYIDCNMSNPNGHRAFNIDNDRGLSNFLTEDARLTSVVKKVDLENLYVIPSGSHQNNSTNFFTSARLKVLLEKLSTKVDIIIIDSPPLDSSETTVLATITDASILVANLKTAKKQIKESNEYLKKVNRQLIGVIGIE